MPKRANGSRTTPAARSDAARPTPSRAASARTTPTGVTPTRGVASGALATSTDGRERPSRQPSPADAETVRSLFWENVVREMLMALAARSLRRRGPGPAAPTPMPAVPKVTAAGAGEEGDDDLFDGRIVLLTRFGVRIPVGDVAPLFPCGVMGPARDRTLSELVQCTVFQVRTPEGEVFTLPIAEIRSIVTLSDGTMERLEDSAAETQRDRADDGAGRTPFGFAAFTSLARGRPPELEPPSWNSTSSPD